MGAWSAFDLKLSAGDVLRGRIGERWERRRQNLREAVTAAMRERGNAAKDAVRAEARAAGLGNRVANTWRGQVYPERGVSASAAYVLASRAPHIIAGHSSGEVIRGRDGNWLAIPTPEIKAMSPRRRARVADVDRRLGGLDFVPLGQNGAVHGARALLVARRVRRRTGKRGGFAKASARTIRTGQAEQLVAFVLVRLVRPQRRLPDPRITFRREGLRITETIQRNMQRANAREGR